VTENWGVLRGVDRAISTVARSGHAVFGRDDTPEQAAHDAAKAIDQHRDGLKWYIRPYSYDSRTVSSNFDVPLHPGAQRYYTEMGYLPGDAGTEDAGTQACDAGHSMTLSPGGGCAVAARIASQGRTGLVAALLPVVIGIRRRRQR
jgi:hypothetical protein